MITTSILKYWKYSRLQLFESNLVIKIVITFAILRNKSKKLILSWHCKYFILSNSVKVTLTKENFLLCQIHLLEERSFFMNHRVYTLRKISSARYMIFCGAPRHLTGVAGRVKNASPPLNFCKALKVSFTVFTE